MLRSMTLAVLVGVATVSASQSVQKEEIAGVRNYSRVDATIGCAGATEAAAIPELAKRGYKTIINLREAAEPGAAIEESRAAAAAAGMKFVHLPFNGAKPDPAVVDAFIANVSTKANEPIYVNCGTANRVAAVWMAKRMVVDGWPEAKAAEEAAGIGLTSTALRQFVVQYAAAKRK